MAEICVNGVMRKVGRLDQSLLDYLRNDLDLRGTKRGCGIGACGSCTVLVDYRPMRACVVMLEKVLDRSILTIEGMRDENGELHPIQKAFIDAGAIQCGFCAPGMVMSSYALLRKNPNPSREDIRKALKGNLCRCTGYQQIVDAVQRAASAIRE